MQKNSTLRSNHPTKGVASRPLMSAEPDFNFRIQLWRITEYPLHRCLPAIVICSSSQPSGLHWSLLQSWVQKPKSTLQCPSQDTSGLCRNNDCHIQTTIIWVPASVIKHITVQFIVSYPLLILIIKYFNHLLFWDLTVCMGYQLLEISVTPSTDSLSIESLNNYFFNLVSCYSLSLSSEVEIAMSSCSVMHKFILEDWEEVVNKTWTSKL